jgi:branched-chain amino acid transport system substrate-binding protein
VQDFIDKGCRMVFGGASSAVAIEAGRICQQNGVPFFGTLTYSTATTLEEGHRFVFRECNDSWMSAKVLEPWLNQRFAGKRYFYITSNYTWGWTTEQSLRQATGTQDARKHPRLPSPLGSTDFKAQLQQAAAFKPDVLVLVLFGKDLSACLRTAFEMGISRACQVVVPNLTLGMAERAGAEAMEGVVGTMPWDWSVPYIENYAHGQKFVEEFVRRFRRYPSTSGASAYTIVYEYKAAVERAGSFAGGAVVKALEGHSYQRLKGLQVWRALDHQSVQTVYLVRGNSVDRVLDDPLRMNYFEILANRPGPEIVYSEEKWKSLRTQAGRPPHLEPLGGD